MFSVYHPDYGYTDQFRLTVCKTAIILGKRKAAHRHGVSIPSVYNWMKAYNFEAIMRA